MHFGDLSMSKLHVGEFQSDDEDEAESEGEQSFSPFKDAVPAFEVPKEMLIRKIEQARTADEAEIAEQELKLLIKKREFLLNKFRDIVWEVTGDDELTNKVFDEYYELKDFDCNDEAVDEFDEKCFKVGSNEYSMKYLYVFRNLCEMGYGMDVIANAMKKQCTHGKVYGIV